MQQEVQYGLLAAKPRGEIALADTQPLFLSTLPAADTDRRRALAVAGLSALFFLAVAPFATIPLAKSWAFIPIYQTAQIVNDLITAILLYGQFNILRSKSLAVLASGYLFVAFIAVFHILSFPGLFAPAGLLGGGMQSTAWLYMFWHAGFPLFVIAYGLLKGNEGRHEGWEKPAVRTSSPARVILLSVIGVLIAAAALTALATLGEDLLPAIMRGNRYTEAMFFVVLSVWTASIAALIVLWRSGTRSVLDLWLLVVICAWAFDIALSALLNAGRFDLGFYAGRIYGLLASSFVLLTLLIENGRLYARICAAQGSLALQNRDLQREVSSRIETESALQRMCDELEYRVCERTASLEAAMKELESFSYSVSHDLKTPLRAVLGLAAILKEDPGAQLNDDKLKLIQMIGDNARRMGQLIDDLLAFSHIARNPIIPKPFDTFNMVKEVREGLSAHGGSRVNWQIHSLPPSYGEPKLLRQVWENLLSNAVKFSAENPLPLIEIGGHEDEVECVFFIRDNGVGFDMEYYDKLFGVFQRLHRQDQFPGTGVGLAIVQRIVVRHGGRVWAESRPDEGATFYFALPRGAGHG